MAYLILVRHGESEWNQKGLCTGLTDVALNQKGIDESKKAGESLKSFPIDIAYSSPLLRAKQTLDEIKNVLKMPNLTTIEDKALNERDYGIYTGKNKWEIRKELGEEKFQSIRRGWDSLILNGETLKNVYERVIPYYQSEILPNLKSGKNVLIVAHGNSLRSLIKYLENISDLDVADVELATGGICIYTIGENGTVGKKQVLGSKIK